MSIPDIILLVLSAVAPAVATFVTVQLAKLNGVVNGLPKEVKQVLVVVVGVGFGFVTGDPTVIRDALIALFAFLIHRTQRTPAAA